MDHHNNLPSFSVATGGPAGCSYQGDATEPKFWYRGMSVQMLNSPHSACFSQSNENQKNAHSVNPLNEYHVADLMQVTPDNFHESDPLVNSESFLDEYASWNSDIESVEYRLFPTLGSYLCNQLSFLGNEPDNEEPTPANCLNLNHHLTDLPAELANSQDSRPSAEVNPPNLQQTTSENPANSAEVVDDKSSQVELECKRKKRRERYQNDPDFAEHERKRMKESMKERRKNPAFAEHLRERQRKTQRQRQKNPTYAKRTKERRKERYQNDFDFAQRERERRKERYQNDPIKAEGQRIYIRIYNIMKKKFGKEEASKLASAAREEYFQSVNSSEDTGDLAKKPTTNSEIPHLTPSQTE